MGPPPPDAGALGKRGDIRRAGATAFVFARGRHCCGDGSAGGGTRQEDSMGWLLKQGSLRVCVVCVISSVVSVWHGVEVATAGCW